jgi:potassium channel subfamily K
MSAADMESQPLLGGRRGSLGLDAEKAARCEQQAAQAKVRTRLSLFTAFWLVLGILVGTRIEGWTLLTSCYVFVQIVTTVGYGDITVTEPRMKLFMAFYVMVSILLIAGFFSDSVNSLLQGESKSFMKNLKKAGDKADGVNEPARHIFDKAQQTVMPLLTSGLLFAFFVAAGTIFFATKESCSCSYGATQIKGCVEDRCEATGGAIKGWIDSFYMSVITLTTVGFGDHSPKSVIGRIFGCFWMAFGVGTFANFVTEFSKAFLKASRKGRMMSSQDVFKLIDTDDSGFLVLHEFREFALLKWGLVEPEQMSGIDALFSQIDKSGDGHISMEELQVYCGK